MKVIIVLFVVLILVVLVSASYLNGKGILFTSKGSTVTIGANTFAVEVEKTPAAREQGLSGRSSLQADHGMLFLFDTPDRYAFWMKDMYFPLDIIWILDGKVVYLEKNVPANFSGIIDPPTDANQVLEINAGNADKTGINEGDKVVSF